MHVNIRHIAAFKFVVLVLGVAHWVGCLFYFLARLANFSDSDNSRSWTAQFDEGTPMNYTCATNATVFDLYAVTIYKGLNGISNLGYDPVIPERYVPAHIVLSAYCAWTAYQLHMQFQKTMSCNPFRLAALLGKCATFTRHHHVIPCLLLRSTAASASSN